MPRFSDVTKNPGAAGSEKYLILDPADTSEHPAGSTAYRTLTQILAYTQANLSFPATAFDLTDTIDLTGQSSVTWAVTGDEMIVWIDSQTRSLATDARLALSIDGGSTYIASGYSFVYTPSGGSASETGVNLSSGTGSCHPSVSFQGLQSGTLATFQAIRGNANIISRGGVLTGGAVDYARHVCATGTWTAGTMYVLQR